MAGIEKLLIQPTYKSIQSADHVLDILVKAHYSILYIWICFITLAMLKKLPIALFSSKTVELMRIFAHKIKRTEREDNDLTRLHFYGKKWGKTHKFRRVKSLYRVIKGK